VAGRGGADVLVLSCPVAPRIEGSTATARFGLRAGEVVGFALHHANSWQARPPVWNQTEITQRLEDTMEGWRSWSTLHQAVGATGTTATPGCATPA
jgi:alpha,alpha-trehalase